jgi:hypothetical protein
MQLNDDVRPVETGEQDPNLDTNSLGIVLVLFICYCALIYVLFSCPQLHVDNRAKR